MTVTLNHTIVHARDPAATARFFSDILSLPPANVLGHFTVVQVDDTSLDFIQTDAAIKTRHFAFLVSEGEFDQIFQRIQSRDMPYWADPMHRKPGEINHWDDGRGVYFEDPNGHNLEILTRPYGSGGLDARHPNPLLGE
jgi:catechol 2,3-dioxygenase-like lactoylglutathione lyase family enzyme